MIQLGLALSLHGGPVVPCQAPADAPRGSAPRADGIACAARAMFTSIFERSVGPCESCGGSGRKARRMAGLATEECRTCGGSGSAGKELVFGIWLRCERGHVTRHKEPRDKRKRDA